MGLRDARGHAVIYWGTKQIKYASDICKFESDLQKLLKLYCVNKSRLKNSCQ